MSWDRPDFVVGEVVALRSSNRGGLMTIEHVDDDEIGCVWLDRTAKQRRDKFPRACLKKSSDADGHIIFLPADNLDERGVASFMAGEHSPMEPN